jgi:molybdenum cofactor cytidylyltransferase
LEIARVRTVVLAGGRSQRMGFDKLVAPFAGEPLARRIARGLAELEPLFVATPQVADAISDVRGVRVIVTEPTAGPSVTLALAHAAIPADAYLAVLACDLPLIDAERVRRFVARVPDTADLTWPTVADVPGHPVVWSPKARSHIPALRADEPPVRVRRDPSLSTGGIDELDMAHVLDVDTPDAWARAEARARQARG